MRSAQVHMLHRASLLLLLFVYMYAHCVQCSYVHVWSVNYAHNECGSDAHGGGKSLTTPVNWCVMQSSRTHWIILYYYNATINVRWNLRFKKQSMCIVWNCPTTKQMNCATMETKRSTRALRYVHVATPTTQLTYITICMFMSRG